MDGGTTGGPVVKTRVCMGMAANTLARLLQVSSRDQAKGREGTAAAAAAECDGDGTILSSSCEAELRAVVYQPARTWRCEQDAMCATTTTAAMLRYHDRKRVCAKAQAGSTLICG